MAECAIGNRVNLGWSWLRLDMIKFSRAQPGTQPECFEGISGWLWRLLKDRKPFSDAGFEVVPGGGIEPSTHGFSVRAPEFHNPLEFSLAPVRSLPRMTRRVLTPAHPAFAKRPAR
jgi:hypothetical protein